MNAGRPADGGTGTTSPVMPTAGPTFAEVLRHRAAETPNAPAFRFLGSDQRPQQLSYAELDRRAAAIAAAILDVTGGGGDPALLLLPPGTDYVAALFGCFYAGVPAVPAFPPSASGLQRDLTR